MEGNAHPVELISDACRCGTAYLLHRITHTAGCTWCSAQTDYKPNKTKISNQKFCGLIQTSL